MVVRSKKALILTVALTVVAGVALTAWGRNSARNSRGPVSNSIRKSMRALLRATQSTSAHTVGLRTAQVSMLDGNRIVILMDATGEMPGSFTLVLDRDSAGTTVIGGSWALIVSYTDLTPVGHPDGDGDGEATREQLVQKGTLSGTVSGGTLTVDLNGNVVSVDSLQLVVNQGSVAYEGVTAGSGSAQQTDLQDTANSAGTLILTF